MAVGNASTVVKKKFQKNILQQSCCFDNIFNHKFDFFLISAPEKKLRSLSPLYLKYLSVCVKSFGVSCPLIPLYLHLIADNMDLLKKMMVLTCSMNDLILI